MILKEILKNSRALLQQNNIEDYDLISKILVEHVFGIEKNRIIIHQDDELDDVKCAELKRYSNKIIKGTPVQYITNNQEFMKLNFYVDENVLIPQPDTEILVEEVINEYRDKSCKILDLCTGSGAIAVSLAKYIDGVEVHASDVSERAIQVAKLNAEKNIVHKKMKFIYSDMFGNIEDYDFDAIVSNPPYIETAVIDILSEQVKSEPHLALDGGFDGLKFYKIIANEAHKYIKDGGKLFLEIGYNQKNEVIKLLEDIDAYADIESKKDLGGNDRVIIATVRR